MGRKEKGGATEHGREGHDCQEPRWSDRFLPESGALKKSLQHGLLSWQGGVRGGEAGRGGCSYPCGISCFSHTPLFKILDAPMKEGKLVGIMAYFGFKL